MPGLLVPLLDIKGSTWGWQYRPDTPRCRDGKPVKYETPWQQRNGLDIPPGVGAPLADPTVPLWVTEGSKKADCGAAAGLCVVALTGVWNWRGTNDAGGKVALADWQDIALNGRRVIIAFDGDIARKKGVQDASQSLAQYLAYKGARPEYLWLPDTDNKTGLDDYLAEHSVDELWRLVKPTSPPPRARAEKPAPPEPKPEPVRPVPLADALDVFGKWLHIADPAPIIATAAAVVASLAPGDPVWLLIVGPSSGGKTEILSSLRGLDYVVLASTLSEASLLSGTSKRERASDATGGLMRQIGEFGILLCKDFTSVLSQNADVARKAVAALREIYDGRWDRPIGVDGARVLTWTGKCGFLAGVTPAYDRYATIVNTLGDRYMLLRMPDVDADKQADAALAQAAHETQMRAELAEAMTGLIAGADPSKVHRLLDDGERQRLKDLATFAARARTGVPRDGYTRELEAMPQPEGPARLVKAMRQLYGGMAAIGVEDDTRWSVLTRIAVDCAPAIRTPLMRELVKADGSPRTTTQIGEAVGMVTKTAGRILDDLVLVGIAERTKKSGADNSADLWRASKWLLGSWPLKVGPKSTTTHTTTLKGGQEGEEDTPPTHTPSPLVGSFLSHSEDHPGGVTEADAVANVCDVIGATVVTTATKATDAQNAAYTSGMCIDCHTEPHSAGRPRCDTCHSAWLTTIDGHDRSASEVSDFPDLSETPDPASSPTTPTREDLPRSRTAMDHA